MKALSLILHILIEIYILLISDGQKHERKTYGKKLVDFSFEAYFGVSWDSCVELCKSIKKCKSVNYVRRSGFCQLNNADLAEQPVSLGEGIGYIFSAKSDWSFTPPPQCAACAEGERCNLDAGIRCEVTGCFDPDPLGGATIYGNLFHVGTKRLYRCDYGDAQKVRICQEDGSWSSISLKCCEVFEIENASVNIAENGEGIIEAIISCNTGFFHRSVDNIRCNSMTGDWNLLNEVGCIEINVDSWIKVYRTVSTVKENIRIIHSWQSDGNQGTGEFRNDEIVSNWDDIDIDQVRIDIVDSLDNSTSYLLFDGTTTNNMNWFSVDKILNSSWSDLSRDTNIAFFSITGVRIEPTGFLRWTILNASKDSSRQEIDCATDLVWFAFMLPNNYPCETDKELPERVIVYSKSSTGTTWEGGQLGFAKEMIVSVRLNS